MARFAKDVLFVEVEKTQKYLFAAFFVYFTVHGSGSSTMGMSNLLISIDWME